MCPSFSSDKQSQLQVLSKNVLQMHLYTYITPQQTSFLLLRLVPEVSYQAQFAICVPFFSGDRVIEELQGLIPVEHMLGENIYCALASVLLSSDAGKNLSLRQPRELLHCLGKKKKKKLIFYNKYHNECSTFYHCIIHQGAFCSKLSHLSPMLAVLTQQAEFICKSLFFPR